MSNKPYSFSYHLVLTNVDRPRLSQAAELVCTRYSDGCLCVMAA